MDAELKTKWVAALRSGDYKQGRLLLSSDYITPDTKEVRHCCLGVLCEVAGKSTSDKAPGDEKDPNVGYGFLDTILGYPQQKQLWTMNDQDKRSFNEIADFIEANL